MKDFDYHDFPCRWKAAYYAEGGLALSLVCTRDTAFCRAGQQLVSATVEFAGLDITSEIAIKNHSENEGILNLLIAQGVVKEPHRYIRSNHMDIPICRLTDEAIAWIEEEMK